MKQSATKLLPATKGSKVVTILGYIVALIGVILAVLYASGPGGTCAPAVANLSELSRISHIAAFVQLIVSGGLVLLVLGLKRHTGRYYNAAVLVVTVVLLLAQLLIAMGYGFAMGTACTT